MSTVLVLVLVLLVLLLVLGCWCWIAVWYLSLLLVLLNVSEERRKHESEGANLYILREGCTEHTTLRNIRIDSMLTATGIAASYKHPMA